MFTSDLPKLLSSFDEDHGGELQQADDDGALAVVVLLHLPGAEVGRPLAEREAALRGGQVAGRQLRHEETHSAQEARLVSGHLTGADTASASVCQT